METDEEEEVEIPEVFCYEKILLVDFYYINAYSFQRL